jgi:hypothetical protein
LKIRLLGDAVLRRMAWELADQVGWATTYDAEYLALTRLQADAFITLDAGLAKSAEGIVPWHPSTPSAEGSQAGATDPSPAARSAERFLEVNVLRQISILQISPVRVTT